MLTFTAAAHVADRHVRFEARRFAVDTIAYCLIVGAAFTAAHRHVTRRRPGRHEPTGRGTL